MNTSMNWLQELHASISGIACCLKGRSVPLVEGFDALELQLKATRAHEAAVWWVGNGGSSAICSHLSQDVMNKLGVRSHTLSDPSLLTCMANDYGYEEVYARPLATLASQGDLLIAISSSGKSENILKAATLAQEKGLSLITLSAFSPENPLWQIKADISFHVPTQLYGQAEVAHHTLLHAAVESLWLKEQALVPSR